MKNLNLMFFASFLMFLAISCKKKEADVAPVDVPERLVMTLATQNVIAGQTVTYSLTFYDKKEMLATVPTNIVWSSSNTAIATVNNGVATGVSAGQATIKATYQSPGIATPVEATALLTVLAAGTDLSNVVATVTIQQTTQELSLNATTTLQAVAKNSAGTTLTRTITWATTDANLVSVNASSGLVTGLAYGTANITATADGIQSSPIMVQVIRSSTFSGNSSGTVKLKIENGVLKLQTGSNFISPTSPPDLRIYLSNNATNVTGGVVQIATLNTRTGAQTWNLPAGTTISQYRYAVVWCLQFNAFYGGADFGL